MTDYPLPPLPKTPWVGLVHESAMHEAEWTSRQQGYTAEDMTEYARTAVLKFLALAVDASKGQP